MAAFPSDFSGAKVRVSTLRPVNVGLIWKLILEENRNVGFHCYIFFC
jgi:hypothetical protein